jgi:hypothetical protein
MFVRNVEPVARGIRREKLVNSGISMEYTNIVGTLGCTIVARLQLVYF